MLVLGIEAATSVAGVALCENQNIIAERFVNNQRTHSVNLLPMIKAVFQDAGVSPQSLEGIAVSNGPGSFTGLRIGMSTAKTLAQVWDLPIVGISTLDSLAYAVVGLHNYICPILNARKNEVYTALYDGSKGALQKIFGPQAISPEKLVEKIKSLDRDVTFLGDGVSVYQKFFSSSLTNIQFASGVVGFPRGAGIAILGHQYLLENGGIDPLQLLPNYIRLSEAEYKWMQKQKVGACGK